jgi:hypothetical protein
MFVCGGVLIHPEVVLSAGHCGFFSGEYVFVSGYQYQSTKNGAIMALVVDDVRHPDYDSLTQEYDYFLHRLDSPVDIGSQIVLELNDDPTVPVAGQTLTTLGLGLTKLDGKRPKNLQYVDVQYIPNELCSNDYKDEIFDTMLCAGVEGGGKDSCQGDSGGPIVTMDGNIHNLVGIVSWGEGCARPNAPGVYARISSGIDWMRQVVCEDWGLDDANFCLQPTAPPSVQPSPQPSVQASAQPTLQSSMAPSAPPQPTNSPTTATLVQSVLTKLGNDTVVVDFNTTYIDSNSTNSTNNTCFEIDVLLMTDSSPQENTLTLIEWSMVDQPSVLLDVDNLNASTAYAWNFCLDTNQTCAILNFTDSAADGLADNGTFSVLFNGEVVYDEWDVGSETIVAFGADCADGYL